MMRIFYDDYFDSYDCLLFDGDRGPYYSYAIGDNCWYLIDDIAIGGRQIPDTVLILIGAPKLETESCQ